MSGPLRAFLNRSENNFLSVVLPDDVRTLGTRVTVETSKGTTYTREAVTSVGMMSDQTSTLVFGLGALDRVEKVTVRPVDGPVKVITQPLINQNLILN